MARFLLILLASTFVAVAAAVPSREKREDVAVDLPDPFDDGSNMADGGLDGLLGRGNGGLTINLGGLTSGLASGALGLAHGVTSGVKSALGGLGSGVISGGGSLLWTLMSLISGLLGLRRRDQYE